MTQQQLQQFENTLWAAANQLRGTLDASQYKDIVLGLIFLKYVSDKFVHKRKEIAKENPQFIDDHDFYDNVFYVPKKARWDYIVLHTNSEKIKLILDEAFQLIEDDNEELKGILPKIYSKEDIAWERLSALIELFSNNFTANISDDVLGRVYEYFLGEFARFSGQKGGEFYTPSSVVKLLVELIQPYNGRVYDPACGSGGMFVQAEKFIKEHGGNQKEISIYGQELNATTWRLAKMNLAIRGITANLGQKCADTFLDDQHQWLNGKVDYVLANPPFNMSEWNAASLQDDCRWKYGVPPKNNANYGWLQHMISKLNNKGVAGIVLANGSLSTANKAELAIRTKMIKDNIVDCIVTLPDKLFYTTAIPCSLWILRKGKSDEQVLFINAESFGEMLNRKVRILTTADISNIANIYKQWLQNKVDFKEQVGITKSVTIAAISEKSYSLVPGTYVGYQKDEKTTIEIKTEIKNTTAELLVLLEKSKIIEKEVIEIIKNLDYQLD